MSDQYKTVPPRVLVTPQFIADMDAKQAAYSAQRARYAKSLEGRPADDEPFATEPTNSFKHLNLGRKRRVTRRREDPLQLTFELCPLFPT